MVYVSRANELELLHDGYGYKHMMPSHRKAFCGQDRFIDVMFYFLPYFKQGHRESCSKHEKKTNRQQPTRGAMDVPNICGIGRSNSKTIAYDVIRYSWRLEIYII
ncbi:hypothetical protein NC652_027065 [Populus alba x Populus x berolinensis]|nr:hypothetical protein NC652_027065 [Populus alba x Populus x berolinensis]